LKKKYKSITSKLKDKKKITKEFEIMLNSLSLEEVISLKLELAAKITKGKLYLPLYASLNHLVKQAAIRFACTVTNTHKEASILLGVDYSNYKKNYIKYKVSEYLEMETSGGEVDSIGGLDLN